MTDLITIQELSAAGRNQECLQACQNALQTNPEVYYAYKYAGKSLLALGQFEKAQQYLVKAHQLDGSDPEIVKDIGNIFLNLSDTAAALEWYEKALEINNNYAPAINNIASLKRQSGNTQEAINLFKRAIHADSKLIQAYVGVAASFLAIGDIDQAESFAHQALAINENTPGINEILGIIFQNKNKPDQAVEFYQKELGINPKADNSFLNLGLLLLQKGQAADAAKSLSKASALAPSEQCSLLLAQAYQNLGQFKEAIVEYRKLDIDQSKNKIIPFNLGLCLLNTGNNIDAVEAFKIVIQLDESFIPAWTSIGNALMNEGRQQEALPAIHKALALDPNIQGAYLSLGGIYKNLGQLDQALSATLKSLELQPDNPDAYSNLGGIYLDLGRLDQALSSTLKSLELKPDNPGAYLNLGGIYKELGQLDQALAATLKSLELKPDNPGAYLNLGGIYKELGQLDQALASTLKTLEIEPDNPDAHINLGGIYKTLGQLDQALAATLRSLELKPDNQSAYLNLGGIYQELGQLDQALTSTLKTLEIKPDNPDAHINLGGIYLDLGQLDQALTSTLKTLEIKPDNPDAHINLGGIYLDLGQLDQALTSTLKTLEIKPDNPDAHRNLGVIYQELGQLDQALASTLKSLELKPDNPDAHRNLGGIYQELGQLDQALASTLKSLELQPDNPITHKNMGIILLEKGEEKDAINCFEKAAQLKPSVPNLCMSKLHFPRIAMSSWEIKEQRNNYLSHIKKIFRERNVKESDKNFIDLSLFMLTYQNGKDDKELLQEIGKIVHPWLEVKSKNETSAVADFRETDSKANQKRRIGFYFDNPHKGHVIFQHYFNLVKSINKENIDVALIKGPLASSKSSKELENYVSRTIQLPNNLRRSVEMIIKLKLDVLIYTEIHSSHAPYCLAHNRLAKVQMVLPGNSITTGIKTVDYFISSKYTETNASEENYTERLIKINGIPTGIEIKSHKVRKDICDIYGIPKDVNLVSLLHNPAKFHPDWDEILEEVAQKCYNTTFLVLDFSERSSSLLSERWEKYAPTLLEKSKFMKPMPKVDYLSLISFCDALLDPLHRGCGTTAYEALAKGIPIVTKPGLLARSRLVYGLYQIMNIKDAPIAYSNSDYIALCIEITSNKNKLLHLKSQIKSKFHKIISSNFRATEELANLLSEI
ncbi:tetratricopeptide repeat protein [Synechococcus sp. UW179A]|uniref:tetratricopeptide repeat protein n=1 Tax=Synechococcus sp. UW179A TaxID=2575510 RepID=UPI00148263DF|nr:tetratricopeptide repeat protein [Synechococcus sp. UW179A]